eukprot:Gb_20076 [translate_table: standard]
MECNKDEAKRAMEIAEKKFGGRDLTGAKKFALKGQRLYPGLEGLNQLIEVLDVHLAAAGGNEQKEYYKILQVDEFAEDSAIKKQYRKLALALHPDKNNATGAEEAFKLIGEAWAVLSNKTKRAIYDQKRRILNINSQKPFKGDRTQSQRNPVHSGKVPPAAGMCSNQGFAQFHNVKFPSGQFSKNTDTADADDEEEVVHMNVKIVLEALEKFKKMEAQREAARMNEMKKGKENDFKNPMNNQFGQKTFFFGKPSVFPEKPSGKDAERPSKRRKGSDEENYYCVDKDYIQRMCRGSLRIFQKGTNGINKNVDCKNDGVGAQRIEKAEINVLKKEEDGRNEVEQNASSHSKGIGLVKGKQKEHREVDSEGQIEIARSENRVLKENKMEPKKHRDADSEGVMEDQNVDNIIVPDSDFYVFDEDRTEGCFEANQIWAVYDDEDGMPRFYARIQKVYSLDPFKVHITWLEAKNNNDPALVSWEKAGFYKGCGEFKAGKGSRIKQLNIFSHVMKWDKVNGVVKILPRKGDVWALYTNWASNWDESTPEEVRHKYEMVEVLSDFRDDIGVRLYPLVKLAGFKAVFQKKGSSAIQVQEKNILRFSHQVPARRLTGKESLNIPKGCWELDPAAIPAELLQVIPQDCGRDAS